MTKVVQFPGADVTVAELQALGAECLAALLARDQAAGSNASIGERVAFAAFSNSVALPDEARNLLEAARLSLQMRLAVVTDALRG